jgi:hypothetical protein
MAPLRGNNKNKEIISGPEPPLQNGVEIIVEEPKTSRDAEIEALRREVETLTEALKIQQPQNRVGGADFIGFWKPICLTTSPVARMGQSSIVNNQSWIPACERSFRPPIHHTWTSLYSRPSCESSRVAPR